MQSVKAQERTGKMGAVAVKKAKKLAVEAKCPNCGKPVRNHPENGCILGAMIQVVRERGEVPEARLRRIHAKVDADAFWNHAAKIVDMLSDGVLSDMEKAQKPHMVT